MGKMRGYFLCAIFCLSFLSLGFSQTVILKSGQKVEGRIIEQTDKYVKLEFQGVELVFYSDEISSIKQTPSEESGTLTVQMELLYKAYTSSHNAPESTKNEEAKEVTKPFLFEKTQIDQTVPTPQDERVKSIITKRQAGRIRQKEKSQ